MGAEMGRPQRLARRWWGMAAAAGVDGQGKGGMECVLCHRAHWGYMPCVDVPHAAQCCKGEGFSRFPKRGVKDVATSDMKIKTSVLIGGLRDEDPKNIQRGSA